MEVMAEDWVHLELGMRLQIGVLRYIMFVIHGCLAPLPNWDQKGNNTAIQTMLDTVSRNLQEIRQTVEMNASSSL